MTAVDEAHVALQALRMRRPIPDEIANAPEVRPDLEIFWAAFWDLRGERGADLPIPYSKARAWCRDYGMSEDDFADLWFLVRRMDETFMEWAAKQRKAQHENDRRSGKRDNGPARPR